MNNKFDQFITFYEIQPNVGVEGTLIPQGTHIGSTSKY